MREARPHIVLIEDEQQIRRFLRMTLEADGMRVFEAATGRQGLAEIRARQPDLVFLDLGLPDMDGVEVVRQLREWSPTPVLVLSARSDEMQKVEALDAGADDYLTKPFGLPELKARVRAHLRRQTNEVVDAGPQIFNFGDVTIDFLHRKVTRNEQLVHLTPIEYKLLATLVRNAGRVLTHTQLLREVWGPGQAMPSTATIFESIWAICARSWKTTPHARHTFLPRPASAIG